jgi:LysM repeat protein
MQRLVRKAIFGLGTALLSVAIVLAQANNCPELVNDALEAMDNNCAETGRNQACYGYDQVEASFLVDVDNDFFSEPADVADVAEIETIRTAPLSVEDNSWGVALLNIQADLPNTIPGQNVTFILLGDVEVENAVAPEDAFEPSDGITITIAVDSANVRSGVGSNFNVLGGVRAGDSLEADALSEDGVWLRVAFEGRPAWIERSIVEENADIDELPTLTEDSNTPMQAFYLRTGIGQPECEEASDNALLVQGPENVEIELTVNGANVRLGSSGALTIVMVGGQPFLRVAVFDGQFVVDGVTIPAGQQSLVCLGDEDSRGLDGESNDLSVTCPPSPPEPIDPNDFISSWCLLEEISIELLNYALDTCFGNHTVASGENLFRISQFYCVTMEELIALNGITDPNQLFVGQVLLLPMNACEGEGSTRPPTNQPLPPVVPPVIITQVGDNNSTAGVDCSSFVVTTSQIIATNFMLSWTAAVGADEYEIAVFDNSGYQVSSTRTNATSIAMNGGEGFPSEGYLDVRAYRQGAYACYTRMNFVRAADPNPPQAPQFRAEILNCGSTGSDYRAVILWENATAVPISITYTSGFSGPTTVTDGNPSGTKNIYTGFSFYNFSSITITDGNSSINLGGC